MPVPDLSALEAAKNSWEQAEERVRLLAEGVARAAAAEADLEQLERMAQSMQTRLTEAAGRACPTCGRPWGKAI
jgi:DNA repair exonuclease SbcCD ATPase subunit